MLTIIVRISNKPERSLFMKHTILSRVTLIVFLFLLPVGCDGPAEEAGEEVDETVEMQKEKLDKARDEIAEAKAEIKELQEELAAARRERDEAKNRLDESEQQRQRILQEIEQSGMANPDFKDQQEKEQDSRYLEKDQNTGMNEKQQN